jgi:hypothetical protein
VIAIVDLVAVCVAQQRWSQRLFEQCGVWVATTRHPPLQQLMAVATHRHAWHAELWGERRPAIPCDSPLASPADAAATDSDSDAGRAAAYASELQAMLAALDQIRAGADRALDPATHRTLDLVTADLVELGRRVSEAMPPG